MVDNPQVRELKRKRAGLVSELNRLKIELTDHLLPRPANKRPPPRRSQKEVRDSIAVAQSAILLTDGVFANHRSEAISPRLGTAQVVG